MNASWRSGSADNEEESFRGEAASGLQPMTALREKISVVALMEGSLVTGPAKNLIAFAVEAAKPAQGLPAVDLTLITYQRGAGENAFAAAATAAGIRSFTIAERRRFDLRVLPELRSIIGRCRPDILQSHNIKSHLFVRLLGLHRKHPWIAFNHGYTDTNFRDRVYNQFDRWSLRAADRVVAVCGPFASRLKRGGVRGDRIRVQHNSVKPFSAPATATVEELRRKLGLRDAPVVLAAGRLSREKGHAVLLQAAGGLARQGLEFQLVIAGDGPEREELRRLAGKYNLGGRAVFAGRQTDMSSLYAMSTILALPSHSEGSPNVVLEAMAAGVPVVATAVGGVPEIIEDRRTGLIVPPGDPAAMAHALGELLADDNLRRSLSDAGRERVERYYTPSAYRRSLTALYLEVLDERLSRAARA